MSIKSNMQAPFSGNTVYLSNLPYEAHEGAIREAFENEQIEVANVQLLKKGSFNRCRNSGLACVSLTKAADVADSCKLLDGKALFGRPMIVRTDKFVADEPGYVSKAAVELKKSSSQS